MLRPLVDLLRALLAVPGALWRFLRRLLRLLWALLGALLHHKPKSPGRVDKAAKTRCVPIQDPAMRVPDPLVYSQEEMSALGLPVTWDNPDFALFDGAVQIGAHELQPNRSYEVRVRVWNAATDCPVAMMPVHLSFLDFGAGTVSNPIGSELVDVGVLGAPNNPAYARFVWHTPATPGHYCLQAQLDPASDRNRRNNLGQHNTDVVEAHSPAQFTFTLRNDTRRTHAYEFDTDAFVLRPQPCPEPGNHGDRGDQEQRLPTPEPLPAGWTVTVSPDQPALTPGQQTNITVVATPPSGWSGTQRVNVHAFYREGHQRFAAGGVSVDVVKA
ncbi:MAG: hypothetical protein WAW88_18070 [Nocardioides sp.]